MKQRPPPTPPPEGDKEWALRQAQGRLGFQDSRGPGFELEQHEDRLKMKRTPPAGPLQRGTNYNAVNFLN
jgi:hypothetical protein